MAQGQIALRHFHAIKSPSESGSGRAPVRPRKVGTALRFLESQWIQTTSCAHAPSQGVQTLTALTLVSGTASPRISSRAGVRVTEKNRRP